MITELEPRTQPELPMNALDLNSYSLTTPGGLRGPGEARPGLKKTSQTSFPFPTA